MASRKETILNVAETMARQGGYRFFSFREIAKAIGIKSSSVHYHFATKEALGAALARRYTARFLKSLGDPLALQNAGQNPIAGYVAAFKRALVQDQKMCLCGLLAAENDSLPEVVARETRIFFQSNIEWLERAYSAKGLSSGKAQKRAFQTLALLEGAMITSKALADDSVFDQATELLFDL